MRVPPVENDPPPPTAYADAINTSYAFFRPGDNPTDYPINCELRSFDLRAGNPPKAVLNFGPAPKSWGDGDKFTNCRLWLAWLPAGANQIEGGGVDDIKNGATDATKTLESVRDNFIGHQHPANGLVLYGCVVSKLKGAGRTRWMAASTQWMGN